MKETPQSGQWCCFCSAGEPCSARAAESSPETLGWEEEEEEEEEGSVEAAAVGSGVRSVLWMPRMASRTKRTLICSRLSEEDEAGEAGRGWWWWWWGRSTDLDWCVASMERAWLRVASMDREWMSLTVSTTCWAPRLERTMCGTPYTQSALFTRLSDFSLGWREVGKSRTEGGARWEEDEEEGEGEGEKTAAPLFSRFLMTLWSCFPTSALVVPC